MRIPSILSRILPLASPTAFSGLPTQEEQGPSPFHSSAPSWSQTLWGSSIATGSVLYRSVPSRFQSWLGSTTTNTDASPSPSQSNSNSINGNNDNSPIPPPSHFDDPVDLSVVISWVEDIFSEQWGTLETVKPLFYELGMGFTQVAICVSHEQKNIYVTFRGTDIMEFPDVLSNLNLFWDSFGPWLKLDSEEHPAVRIPGHVQRGWNRKVFNPRLYLPLSDELKTVKQAYPDYRVIIAGHSLGAALSIIYGVYVAKYVMPEDEQVQVINLGAPRVGDEEFYHAIQKIPNLTIWRMVFRNDIVPRCPPMIFGFRHVGHMLHWDENDNVKAYHQQLETCMDSECYAGIDPSDWNILLGSIGDHEHARYKCIVEQAKKDPEKYWPKGFEMLKKREPNNKEEDKKEASA